MSINEKTKREIFEIINKYNVPRTGKEKIVEIILKEEDSIREILVNRKNQRENKEECDK